MVKFNQTLDFDYRPDCSMHNFALGPGKYLFEAWGAAGGSNGGRGAKTSGIISFSVKTNIFVVVGEKGFDINFEPEPARATCGGGGKGGLGMNTTKKYYNGASGGGATTVMIHNATLENRILVSAGGGGNGHTVKGGYAGGLIGGNSVSISAISYGANQTFGFLPGIGENGRDATQANNGDAEGGGGAGGGYFGGTTTNLTDLFSSIGGGGGSSYISGHPECELNSFAKFTKPTLLSGIDEFTLPNNAFSKGNPDNGFFRVTILFNFPFSCPIQTYYHNMLLYITPMIFLFES